MLSLILGGSALAGFLVSVLFAIRTAGQLGPYIGCAGIICFLAALGGIIAAILAIRDDDVFPGLPRAAFLVSLFGALVWLIIYGLGFYFWGLR